MEGSGISMLIVPEHVKSKGIVHGMVFDGEAPSWDVIRAIAYHGETHPSLAYQMVNNNSLTDYAIEAQAGMWVDQYVQTPSYLVLGTGAPPPGQTGPLSSDKTLWAPDNNQKKLLDVKTTFLGTYSEFGYTFPVDEANDVQYTEAGLVDPDNQLWAHVIINFKKTGSQTGVVLWKILHQIG